MSAKAVNYIENLETARCDGNWSAVPELVRKVRKHASDRACLTLTAETECAISNVTGSQPGAGGSAARPSTAATAKTLEVSDRLPKLLAAIEAENTRPEDKFQAQVCVGWLHWVVAEYSLALVRLPKSLEKDDAQADQGEATSEWTDVCALKSAYIRANCLTRNYQRSEALAAFQSGLPYLARIWTGRGVHKQIRYWAELFLTEYCMLTSQALQDNETPLDHQNALACFRSWARFWSVMSSTITGGHGFKGSVPRRRVWSEYYLALSRILEDDLPFPTGHIEKNDLSSRSQLRVELKNVEATYQALLLSETTFPRADEERAEVEAFVRLVFSNWSIMCGRGWREQDLGQGGRNSLSRGILDILYSAATKTFHSPAILRSLFIVHLSVAEFDPAFKAFDSYMEIITKGKARVEKTGHLEPSVDDDGIVLQTMAQCVLALCRYGHGQSADKARQLGAELEDWLSKLPQIKAAEPGSPVSPASPGKTDIIQPAVPPHTIALAWQAIGMSHAHWSRATFEAGSRTEVQSKAVRCLRRSLASDLGRAKDVRSFFALGLILAERRELTAAIEVTRAALMASKGQEAEYSLLYGAYWQERSLIPVWHLLALLLSARQDYSSAVRACEGALEQFKDSAVLFGQTDQNFRSEHLNDAEKQAAAGGTPRGLVDDMDDAEKEAILEVKMTRLALMELLEGPDAAVNASYELLTLFSRLFGSVTLQPNLNPPKMREPPKTSGTLRSIRGSIFGGKADKSRPPTRQPSVATVSEKQESLPTRPATSKTTASTAPAIQVSPELPKPSQDKPTSPQKGNPQHNSLKKRNRSVSRRRTSDDVEASQTTVVDGEAYFTPGGEGGESDFFTFSSKKQVHRVSSFSRGRTLPSLNSYLSSNSKASDYSELAIEATHSTANLLPLISFSKEKERTQRTTILIRVWLMIAGFYRRAEMYEDCKGAIAEAQKLLQSMENEAAREPSGSSGIKGAGWAEAKSIDDLWGDVWAEHGLLAAASETPYTAKAEFESALTHCPDHPFATVGLSSILLDIYTETLLPTPGVATAYNAQFSSTTPSSEPATSKSTVTLPSSPLGLGSLSLGSTAASSQSQESSTNDNNDKGDTLPAPYKAKSLPLVDRLAARDRAYTLLTGLTRLGTGWNYSEAWFALARAYEESGQPDKAKEVLWWCVELEEAMGIREWQCLGGGGYII